ncbi:MAG: STAS domain-containing protein [Planctomycetes bacterium]|nr:STAS domain-containing protein [Planctomycetota bacterium]
MNEPLPFAVQIDAQGSVLKLGETIGVSSAAALHEALVPVLSQARPCRVDWSSTRHADACVLQLISSFSRAGRARGVAIEHSGIGTELQGFLDLSGFAALLRESVGGVHA